MDERPNASARPGEAAPGAETAGSSGEGSRVEQLGETWAAGVSPTTIGPRGRRFRWAVAICVVLVVSIATGAGVYVLSGAAGATQSLTAAYAPEGTIAFVDVRADLPGDQHQNLADFMSHFPGFADRAQFDAGFDDILNRITGAISPDLTYTWYLQGWTTGEVSLAITSFGVPGIGMADSGSGMDALMSAVASQLAANPSAVPNVAPMVTVQSESGVLLAGVKDRAAGERWVASEISRTGLQFTTQDYAGTTLYVAQQPAASMTLAYAFTDRAFIAGDVTDVKAALDAPAAGSLADNSNYKSAMRALSGDCIGTFFLDPKALTAGYLSMLSSVPGVAMALPSGAFDTSALPAWVAGSVRAESDRLTVEIKTPKAPGAASPGNRESALASRLPGSTVAVLELHDIGSSIQKSLDALTAALPASEASAGQQITDTLKVIGGIDWIGDGVVALTETGATLGGGLVIKTPDNDTAVGRKAMITNLISLAGTSYGITETDETYKGTTITMVGIPQAVTGTATGGSPIEIGIAVKDDLIVAGYGDSFAKAMIDTTSGNSLASQSDFQSVMSAVGKSNMEYGYWNVPAMVDQLGQAMFGVSPAYYDLNYKPYFDHLGGVAFASIDANPVTIRLVITAR
jgi:hypothetical protein